MKFYRTTIHGHVIEARKGDWGGETVLLDGRPVSERPLAGLGGAGHFFDLQDETGRVRHVEVRWFDKSRWGLGDYRVLINVDGTERAQLEPLPKGHSTDVCTNCGYRLEGLEPVNGEVQCPECGRHALAPGD